MSQAKEVVVRLKALDGQWEVCGVDRLRGITPDVSPMVTNGWGPDTTGFDLRRDPKAIWPDLRTWTMCEIEIGGVIVWDGYVKATPSRDGLDQVMTVQCQGWQYHLDDSLYWPVYVHSDLAAWKDQRSFPDANLTFFKTAPQVQAGNGVVTILWPDGTAVTTGEGAGVTLDLGPGTLWDRIVVEWERVGASDAGWTIVARGTDSSDLATDPGLTDAWSVNLATASDTSAGTFASTKRYAHVFVYRNGGAGTVSGDVGVRIKSIKLFANAAWESGNASILGSPNVIVDGLAKGTIRLSDDRSRIDPDGTISFGIPMMAPGAVRSPREMWEASNAYYDYRSQIAIGRIPIYEPRPSAAEIEVGNWSAMEADGITPQNDEPIYNHVIVTATTPAGTPIRVERFADGPLDRLGIEQVANPSASTNTAGWTALIGALARDTGTFDSPPASFRLTAASGGSGTAQSASVSQEIKKGYRYRLAMHVRRTANLTGNLTVAVQGPAGAVRRLLGAELAAIPTGSFATLTIDWVARADATSYTLLVSGFGFGVGAVDLLWFDTIEVGTVRPTLVDRQGFVRSKELQVRSPLPADGIAAAQLGDAFLRAHSRTAFKGPVKITGDHSVRHVLTGVPVPLERLQFYAHKLLRFSDRIDPDTGAHGRDAQIEQVAYDPKTNEATVTMDEQRAGFEALLERLAVVTGGG